MPAPLPCILGIYLTRPDTLRLLPAPFYLYFNASTPMLSQASFHKHFYLAPFIIGHIFSHRQKKFNLRIDARHKKICSHLKESFVLDVNSKNIVSNRKLPYTKSLPRESQLINHGHPVLDQLFVRMITDCPNMHIAQCARSLILPDKWGVTI